jgi:hypothetical protein
MSKARTNADNVTADIAGITAGTGITGGGTSGTVTITNSMATAIDAAGDLIYGTGSDAFTRLGLGTAGQLLKVNSGATAPEWGAAPESGGMTLISTTTLTGATTTLSSIPQTYNSLMLVGFGVTNATADGHTRIAPNNDIAISTGTYLSAGTGQNRANTYILALGDPSNAYTRTLSTNAFSCRIDNYTSTTNYKPFSMYSSAKGSGGADSRLIGGGAVETNSAITSLVFSNSGGNFSTGTVLLYGVK